jgi:CheY-like chemotaxis protein
VCLDTCASWPTQDALDSAKALTELSDQLLPAITEASEEVAAQGPSASTPTATRVGPPHPVPANVGINSPSTGSGSGPVASPLLPGAMHRHNSRVAPSSPLAPRLPALQTTGAGSGGPPLSPTTSCPVSTSSICAEDAPSAASVAVGAAHGTGSTSAGATQPGPVALDFAAIRVLIVDDVPMNLRVLERQLRRLGVVCVTQAENGKQAVDAEAGGDFDIVICDLQMPVMGGTEAAAHIVAMHRKPGVDGAFALAVAASCCHCLCNILASA